MVDEDLGEKVGRALEPFDGLLVRVYFQEELGILQLKGSLEPLDGQSFDKGFGLRKKGNLVLTCLRENADPPYELDGQHYTVNGYEHIFQITGSIGLSLYTSQ